jgi:hypothetical protein
MIHSYVSNVFGLHSTYMCVFAFHPQDSDVGKGHKFVPVAVTARLSSSCYEQHATEGQHILVYFNFLLLTIPK